MAVNRLKYKSLDMILSVSLKFWADVVFTPMMSVLSLFLEPKHECVCVRTVILQAKSSPVFFSKRFKNGCLMLSLSRESGGHVIQVVLQLKNNNKKTIKITFKTNEKGEDEQGYTEWSEMKNPVWKLKLTPYSSLALQWLGNLFLYPLRILHVHVPPMNTQI